MITIKGAASLKHFTDALSSELKNIEGNLEILQIHASPSSVKEDLEILEYAVSSRRPRKLLIHRPDELLTHANLKKFFENNPSEKLVFLGDLIFADEFWRQRISHSQVIPHPFLDLRLPKRINDKYIVGANTSWGEMRKLDHYLQLINELSVIDKENKFLYMIGGTIDGRPLSKMDGVIISEEPFIPHFNVQLYHLNGKKRLGESSGSLHRGVTIPVIIEANGMERIENYKVIKIEADNDLVHINFKKAALDIHAMAMKGLKKELEHNTESASKNTVMRFIKQIIA